MASSYWNKGYDKSGSKRVLENKPNFRRLWHVPGWVRHRVWLCNAEARGYADSPQCRY